MSCPPLSVGGSCTAIVTLVEPATPIVAAAQLLSSTMCFEPWSQLLDADVWVGGLGQTCKRLAVRLQHGGRPHHCYNGLLRGKRRTAGKSKFVGDIILCRNAYRPTNHGGQQRAREQRAIVVLGTIVDSELQALMDAIEQRAPLDAWQQRRELFGTRSQNEKGDTPLTWAARLGNAEAVAWLIGRGAGVDSSTTAAGVTPLRVACGQGHVECVRLLLGAGASVDLARTDDGITPLYIACQEGHVECVRLLLGAGASVDLATTDNGATPLLYRLPGRPRRVRPAAAGRGRISGPGKD